ncbi:MAG: M48 family metalloprotease, partial [Deltaproteobacteria bacterium]|nr:M48 family metalloprotease [Deltaproteobacteria bacterium]
MTGSGPADFFEWQQASRQASLLMAAVFSAVAVIWFLVIYFGLDLLLKIFIYRKSSPPMANTFYLFDLIEVRSALLPTLGFAAYTLASSLRRLYFIKNSGSTYVATALGGIPLGETESVFLNSAGRERERILRNVVSEMALAARLPEPDIYIMPKENSINAMAAGLTPDDAAIMITRGSLKYLSREELSGLIGHEFSHILNGDMYFNTIMSGWLHGFFSLTELGYRFLGKSVRSPFLLAACAF